MVNSISERTTVPKRPEFESMVHILAHVAKEHPGHTAIISGQNEINFADYYSCVAGLAHNLIEMGAKDERVIVLRPNSIETAVAVNAVWAAGAQAIMFNPLYTENELRPLVEDASPAIIVCDTKHAEILEPLAETNGVEHFYTFDDPQIMIDQWRGRKDLRLPEPMPKSSDFALLAYTGGTTGLPKGAIHSHAMMLAMAKSMDGLYRTSIASDV